jgi:hypothetical protein
MGTLVLGLAPGLRLGLLLALLLLQPPGGRRPPIVPLRGLGEALLEAGLLVTLVALVPLLLLLPASPFLPPAVLAKPVQAALVPPILAPPVHRHHLRKGSLKWGRGVGSEKSSEGKETIAPPHLPGRGKKP